jgi:hypothetical protein
MQFRKKEKGEKNTQQLKHIRHMQHDEHVHIINHEDFISQAALNLSACRGFRFATHYIRHIFHDCLNGK